MSKFSDSQILVLGSNGFIGKNFMKMYPNCVGLSGEQIRDYFEVNGYKNFGYSISAKNVKAILNLTGYNGNIEFNKKNPGSILAVNSKLNCELFHGVKESSADICLSMFASCAYPVRAGKLYEWDWAGNSVDESVYGHAQAKRHLQSLCKAMSKETGKTFVTMCPPTVVGIGEATYEGKPKVLLAIILKFLAAQKDGSNHVKLLGDGQAKRQFIWVEDLCKILHDTLGEYTGTEHPLNIGSPHNISIRELVYKICTRFPKITAIWGKKEDNGAMRKELSGDLFNHLFGEPVYTTLDDMVDRLIAHYKDLV